MLGAASVDLDPGVLDGAIRTAVLGVKLDANPGVPFMMEFKENAQVITDALPQLVEACQFRLKLWADTPWREVRKLASDQIVGLGFNDITRVFVKQEPHAQAKIDTGRFRLISSRSLIDQICEAVVFRPLVNQTINSWVEQPLKPGIGFTDEMIAALIASVESKFPGGKVGNDVSGWDWSLLLFLFDAAADVQCDRYKRGGCLTERLENAVRNSIYSLATGLWMTSDGLILAQTILGIMKSGSLITAELNSIMRVLASFTALEPGGDLQKAYAISMGDDCLEDPQPRDYSSLGLRITDVFFAGPREEFEFCSHMFDPQSNTAALTSWPRTLYRFLSQKSRDPALLYQLHYELRHNQNWPDILDFIQWVGWSPQTLQRNNLNMATVKALEEAVKRINSIEKRTANNGRVVATKSIPQKGKKKPVKKAAKSALETQAYARGVALPHDCVKEWATAVADPWNVQGCKIPYNPLSVPTTLSTTARVFNTHTITVAANETQQILMFPGHGPWNLSNPLDLVSAHCNQVALRIGGADVAHLIGPMPSSGGVPCCQGMFTSSPGSAIPVGTYNLNTGTAAATTQNALAPAIALPFVANTGDAYHTRWRLVSMGLVITNLTTELNISGSVVTVQPDTAPLGGLAASGPQANFEIYPSFKRFAPNKQVKISWTPRGEDLAWSHVNSSTVIALAQKVAILAWLNSGSAAQSYQIDWVANYELAGLNTRSISSDAVNFPAGRNVIEPAVAAVAMTSASSVTMPAMVHLTAANNAPTMAPAGSTLGDTVSDHARTLAMHATKLLGQGAASALKAVGNQAAARFLGSGGRDGPFFPGYKPSLLKYHD